MTAETKVLSANTPDRLAAQINDARRDDWHLAWPVQGVRSLSAGAEFEATLFTATLQREVAS